jgi:hypothetical protein
MGKATWLHYLDAMIVAVGDDKLADPVNCHTCQTVKFSFRISVTAKFLDEDSIRIEDLNAVVGDRKSVV